MQYLFWGFQGIRFMAFAKIRNPENPFLILQHPLHGPPYSKGIYIQLCLYILTKGRDVYIDRKDIYIYTNWRETTWFACTCKEERNVVKRKRITSNVISSNFWFNYHIIPDGSSDRQDGKLVHESWFEWHFWEVGPSNTARHNISLFQLWWWLAVGQSSLTQNTIWQRNLGSVDSVGLWNF